MTTKKEAGPAFPLIQLNADGTVYAHQAGMTLRDWFAGQALAGILAHDSSHQMNVDSRAALAYRSADAMLAERERV